MRNTKIAAMGRVLLAGLTPILAACTDSVSFEEPALLTVTSSADSLVSGGAASVLISAELPPTLPQDATVEFATSLGRLINPGAAADRKVTVQARDGIAQARLVSAGEVGTAYVSATAAGSTAQIAVELTPSPPALAETIDLFVDRTAAPADGSTAVTVTAVLRRAAGTVSRGIPVRFEARDSASGALLPELGGVVVADSVGTARLRLTSPVPGTLQVRAYVGAAESEPRTIRFTPPPAAAGR